MTNLQIFTPILPYVGRLPGELRYGSRIKLRGHFREPQNTVHIILQKEALLNPQDDLPLYITVHPGRKEIVRNHLCSDCSTGQEERVDNCPIECGQDFELTVVPTSGGYEILLHGAPLHTFSYRTPLTTARYLFVSSGCVIFAINYENWNVTTSEQPHRPQTPSPPLQLPQLYPILHQHREEPQQHQQQRSIQARQQPPRQHHHHHGNNLQELVLQVLPLVQLAASQLQANAHNSPATGNDGNGARLVSNLAHLLPLFQPAVEQRRKRVKSPRTNRWSLPRMNNAEIMPAMFLTCSMGLMKLFRFLIIACVFGYIGYVFSRNTPWNVSWK
ncbi:galectin-4-like isoform X2 [Anopheles stephensi]|uniref:galectin-4-like isoform X2 n=1 Tax=Anopheles stephensi TaxID=30069 RepID=UPI001658BE9F|nr:galectin-4-like isoform X2 [Anopheles stephensi]